MTTPTPSPANEAAPSTPPAWADSLTADISRVVWGLGVRGDEYLSAVKAIRELIIARHAPNLQGGAELEVLRTRCEKAEGLLKEAQHQLNMAQMRAHKMSEPFIANEYAVVLTKILVHLNPPTP